MKITLFGPTCIVKMQFNFFYKNETQFHFLESNILVQQKAEKSNILHLISWLNQFLKIEKSDGETK